MNTNEINNIKESAMSVFNNLSIEEYEKIDTCINIIKECEDIEKHLEYIESCKCRLNYFKKKIKHEAVEITDSKPVDKCLDFIDRHNFLRRLLK